MMLSVLTSSALVSCSKDDEPKKDPIVGTWYAAYSSKTGIVGDCGQKTHFQILENYTFSLSASNRNSSKYGDCEIEYTVNGKWEKVDDKKYKLTIIVKDDKYEKIYQLRNNNKELITYDGDEELVFKRK